MRIPRATFTFVAVLCTAPLLNAQNVRINNADIVAPNGGIAAPTVLQSTVALYTNDARVHGVEGTVTIEAVVGEDGLVQSMRVVKGLGFGLDQSALASVQQWIFSPATQVGTPVSVVAQIDVPFSLANAVFRVGNGVSVPSVQSKVQPEYTDEARLAVVRGTVVLQILVRKDGSVDVLRVVQGLGGGLTENAVEAMKQWKFSPAQAGGEAVNVALNVEVNFNLKDKK